MKNKEDRLVAGEFLYSVAFFYSTHLDLDLIISLCLEVCNSYLYLYRVIIFTCKCSDFLNYFIKIIFYSYLDPIMLWSVFKNRTYSKLNNLVCPLRYHVPLYPTSLIYWSVESFNPYLFTVFFFTVFFTTFNISSILLTFLKLPVNLLSRHFLLSQWLAAHTGCSGTRLMNDGRLMYNNY